MKLLFGKDIAQFIKAKQSKQVSELIQSQGIQPRLAIVSTNDNLTSKLFMKLKKSYGEDIRVQVDVHNVKRPEATKLIKKLNNDNHVHGIIVQLPLNDESTQDRILNSISPTKDVDGLGKQAIFDPATPLAINWLLERHNINLKNKSILIVGKGKLVGTPLARLWKKQGVKFYAIDENTKDITAQIAKADVVVSATGHASSINSNMLKRSAVVIDVGTSEVNGDIKGDLDDDVYERKDLTVTPKKGGVGPLTVAALFENVIKASQKTD